MITGSSICSACQTGKNTKWKEENANNANTANIKKMTKLTAILLLIPTLQDLALGLKSIRTDKKLTKIIRNYQLFLK